MIFYLLIGEVGTIRNETTYPIHGKYPLIPFNSDKVHVNYSLQAYWYFGAWSVGAQYFSKWHTPGNAVNGLWSKSKELYNVSVGWGNPVWNVSVLVSNPFTWNWVSSYNKMVTSHFDRYQTAYGVDRHCYVKLGITYVFGFGKQIKRGDDASRQDGAASAILK